MMSKKLISQKVGAVIIGRNEGLRLVRCLESLIKNIDIVMYVDSGSTDKSVDSAKSLGVQVLSLDMSIPFTAARARNEGATHLMQQYPDLEFIQFVDGDCDVQSQWIESANNFLNENTEYAIVCGRRRERFPEASIYNQLCDIEWNTPIGDALACGGDALIRIESFREVDGYNEELIAGEEPEMCFRLRQQGWKIRRIDVEMTLHDAAMTKLSQWWKRTIRTGYAFALGSSIHGKSKERYYVKENQRIIIWGLVMPIVIFGLTILNPISAALFFVYWAQIVRVAVKRPSLGKMKFIWAASVVLGKFPEAVGLIQYNINKATKTRAQIIEYK
ncbi:MAG: glycosyl transferase [Methylophaga sp.]|nr:MAG: glycosyl transferase [Methylophaga sp.]